jgi:hypothetical protein
MQKIQHAIDPGKNESGAIDALPFSSTQEMT